MAIITTAGSGSWSSTTPNAPWPGGVVPNPNTDIVVISSGHTVIVDQDVTIGSNAAAVGHAITIAGASSSNYGKLVVNDGIALTLKGFNYTTSTAMLINQYGLFEPSPGATISVDCATGYQTIILNNGIINAIGTAEKPIVWTIPDSRKNFAVPVSATGVQANKYQMSNNLWSAFLPWISNSAGTGHASFGDSSLVISGQAANIGMITEVQTLGEVDGPNKYWVDYSTSLIVMYNTSNLSAGSTFDYSAKSFSCAGYGITSEANTAYNEFKAAHNSFNYMGVDDYYQRGVLNVKNKYAATVNANRLFKATYCDFNYCIGGIVIGNTFGTAGDRIDLTHNNYNSVTASTNLGSIATFWRLPNSYLDLSDSTVSARGGCIFSASYGSVNADQTGMRILRMSGTAATLLRGNAPSTEFPGLDIGYCVIRGGGYIGSNLMDEIAGSADSPARIHNNEFRFMYRTMNVSHDVVFEDNLVESTYHHGIYGPNSNKSEQVRNIIIRRNRFVGTGSYDNPPVHSGYNNASWWDNWQVYQNTFSKIGNAAIGFGDIGDAGYASLPINTLITRAVVHSNLSHTAGYWRATDYNDYERHRIHLSVYDYNLDYNSATGLAGGVKAVQSTALINGQHYNTTTAKNIKGISLGFPSSFASDHTLSYDSGGKTLTWGGGSPVGLLHDSGTFTSVGTNVGTTHPYRATAADSAKSWSTSNTGNGPRTYWLKVTSGVAAGAIRGILSNTATVLTVAPAWDPAKIPASGDSYEIWKSEVTLTATDASTVSAGVYLPEFVDVTASDSGITFADYHLSIDPLLPNPTGVTVADVTPQNQALIGTGYLGADIGAYAPAPDTTPPTVVLTVTQPATDQNVVPITVNGSDDESGVAGYYVLSGETTLVATDVSSATFTAKSNWTNVAFGVPASSPATRYICAWARDNAGNISDPDEKTVTLTKSAPSGDTEKPVITAFSIPTTAAVKENVNIDVFTATDNVGVTAYYLSESPTAPTIYSTGWQFVTSATTWTASGLTYTFAGTGLRTLYAWTRDAAGNISASSSDTVEITPVATTVDTQAVIDAITAAIVAAVETILRGDLAEEYADPKAPTTLTKALYMLLQLATEKTIDTATRTMTVKKLDGQTPAMTFQLDSATAPKTITRIS